MKTLVALLLYLLLLSQPARPQVCSSDLDDIKNLSLSVDLVWGAFEPDENASGLVVGSRDYPALVVRNCLTGKTVFDGRGRLPRWTDVGLWFVGKKETVTRLDPSSPWQKSVSTKCGLN